MKQLLNGKIGAKNCNSENGSRKKNSSEKIGVENSKFGKNGPM